ncbi:MAG: hypothetical protein H6662_05750 [Ardenticatenaceae bacterium]|nr:hypothetical protein [Ardenticatenaceae bacterium]MCB8991168.1 hypothetical protein [Ardenticatenaceae bacterium]MCB9005376.1 hypothetical protein [Ardenticatenaceae bacterium]
MPIILIAVGIIVGVIIVGALIAFAVSRLDQSVEQNKAALSNAGKEYNPALTMGFQIKSSADLDEQVKEARKVAAKQAAAMPRGANMGIGHQGQSKLQTAFQGAKDDPWTAAKIAVHHGWDGVRTGPVAAAAAPVATAAAATAAPAADGNIELVPGKDYPVIEITDSMTPAEVRKARIANSKAKSQAMKALKASGAVPQAVAAAPAAPAAAPTASPAASAAAIGIPEPNYIEITDDMPPDEVRKARIQNSKERSKYNKALKAAGVDPNVAAAPVAAPTAAPAPAAPAAPAPASGGDAAALAGIPKPDYVEITDDMSPDDVRKARIQNSKERSKYNKALKAAGIDPASVS